MKLFYALLLLLSLALPVRVCGEESVFWEDFVKFKKGEGAPGLPDFSYAGYAMGERDIPKAEGKRFSVTDYGAIPDDDKSDRAGMIAAIAAAKANGGGIVFFPRGRYLVAEEEDIIDDIRIDSPNIILKGEGCGPGGTEIFMRNHYGNKTPRKMFAVAKLFTFRPNADFSRGPGLAKITADAPRESFSVEVDNTDKFVPGEFVQFDMRTPEANSLYLDGLEPWDIWTDTVKKGVRIAGEHHCIDRVEGKRVYFKEPIHCEIRAAHNWQVRRNGLMPGWGVEDILFRGSQPEHFTHHLNYILDSGWSMVAMHRGLSPYIRRCRFVDASIPVCVTSSYGGTVINCAVEGNRGHYSFSFDYFNYGGLGAFTYDKAKEGSFHGWGASAGAVGTVIYRCKNSDRGFDWHASWPYATLIDNCTGGVVGNGGGVHLLPNHMQYLVFWNFRQTAGETLQDYDFWQKRKGDESYSNVKIVKPYIIGYQGPSTFLASSCAAVESPGKPVSPQSLFEAQTRLRFSRMPLWYEEGKAQYEFYEKNGYYPPGELTR